MRNYLCSANLLKNAGFRRGGFYIRLSVRYFACDPVDIATNYIHNKHICY